MQEQIERESLAVSVNTAKLTGRVLAKVLTAVAHKIHDKYTEAQTPHGRQSVKKLMNHGVATNNIPLNGDAKLFDQVARKYNVDYAFHQTGANKYLLFFKSNQADAITACFLEYSKRVMSKGMGKPSITAQIEKFTDLAKSQTQAPQQRDRAREAAQHER